MCVRVHAGVHTHAARGTRGARHAHARAHTQRGNNNTYCHDSPLNWFNWAALDDDASGYARFFRLLLQLRCARAMRVVVGALNACGGALRCVHAGARGGL